MAARAVSPARQLAAHPTPVRTERRAFARATLRDFGLLLGAVILAHFPLLLNDGLYWDDWLLFRQLQSGDWASVNALVREAGITPFNAAFFDLFAYVPGDVLGFRLVVFGLIVAIAYLTYAIALDVGLPRRPSLLIALLASVFPGFQDWILLATASSVMDYAVFLAATLLLVRAERQGPAAALAARVAAVVLFLLSFSFNSLLTLYFASLLVLLLVIWRAGGVDALRRRRLYLAGLLIPPFAYWWLARTLFVPSGLYANYNAITASPRVLAHGFKGFLVNGILEQLAQTLTLVSRWPVWAAVALVAAAAALLSYRALREPPTLPAQWTASLAVGATALFLAVLPYAAVDKFPSVHGWDTRHDLLIALPLAVVGVMAIEAIAASLKVAWLGAAFVIAVSAVLALAGLQDYAALQARWATDVSVMQQLRRTDGSGRYSVFWVEDQAPGPEDFYRFYEWSAMLGDVYGGPSHVGLDTRAYDASFLGQSQFFTARYDLSGFDPNGCQADLTIERGADYTGRTQVAATYLFYRVFEPDKLSDYLNHLVVINLTPRSTAGCGS